MAAQGPRQSLRRLSPQLRFQKRQRIRPPSFLRDRYPRSTRGPTYTHPTRPTTRESQIPAVADCAQAIDEPKPGSASDDAEDTQDDEQHDEEDEKFDDAQAHSSLRY